MVTAAARAKRFVIEQFTDGGDCSQRVLRGPGVVETDAEEGVCQRSRVRLETKLDFQQHRP